MTLLFGCAMLLSGIGGCKRSREDLGKDVKTYPIRGKVISTDTQTGEVTLAHEAIPGFMEAMTMPYRLADRNTISEIHPGDRLNARLRVQVNPEGDVHNAFLDEVVITSQAKPDYKPTVQYHVPAPGDAVPDFKLTDQDGRRIHLGQFRGKALLITFIYTRCPLSDFCPKMSRNFAEIHRELQRDKSLNDRTDLLSISFDPVYDTPAVLRSYGGAYTGQYTNERFGHWQFAVPDEKSLAAMEQFFNVGVTPGDSNSLNHSLSTVLIDPAGKIAAWYPTNDWKPADLVARMQSLISAPVEPAKAGGGSVAAPGDGAQ